MRVLALAALLAALAPPAAGAADPEPRATLSLSADGTPTIRYRFEPRQESLSFADREARTHSIARTQFWSHDKACFAIEPERIVRLSESCGEAEFRLTWDELARDRMYPGVVRLRNGGALVFSSYLQPLGDDGSLAPWSVAAPGGGVAAFRGEKTEGSIAMGARYFSEDGRGWIYLGPDRFVEGSAGRVLVDDGIAPALEAEMESAGPRLLEAFSKGLGVKPADRPSLYLTWANRDGPGRELQADVVPGATIRFTVMGSGWARPDAEALRQFREVLAHEQVHLWNGGVFRPMSWAAPWISEGSAELLALAALFDTGMSDSTRAAERVAQAFNDCALAAGDRAWVQVRERDRGLMPYTCGLAIQFGVLALARRHDASLDAFALWRGAWQQTPRYYEAALQQHLLRVGAAEAAAALQGLLTDAAMPLAAALRALYRAGGIAPEPVPQLTRAQGEIFGWHAMIALMRADCGGAYGFWQQGGTFLTDKVACANFKPQMRVRYFEGADVVEEPARAMLALHAACRDNKAVRVGGVDAAEITVPCDVARMPDPAGIVAFEAAGVAAVLTGEKRPSPQPSPKGEGVP